MREVSWPEPLVTGVLLFTAGIGLGTWFPLPAAVRFLLLGGAALLYFTLLSERKAGIGRFGLSGLLLLLGLLHGQNGRLVSERDLSRLMGTRPLVVRGTVLEELAGEGALVIGVKAIEAPTPRPEVSGRLLVSLGESAGLLAAGDQVRVRLDPLAAGRGFSTEYRNSLARRGIHTLARVVPADFSLVAEAEEAARSGWPERMRSSIRRLFERQVPDETRRSIMAAVSFGFQRPAAPLRDGFQRLGIYHLLVVSGLHVAYFNYFFSLLLLPFRPGPRLRSILHLPALALYAMLCGFSAPVLRATLMAGFHHLGIALNRESRPLNAISLAAFVLLVRDPGQLFEPGWQLTFVITAALILGASRCRQLFEGLPGWLSGTLGATLAGQAAGLPLGAFYFGQVPLLGLIVNPFFIPLAGLLVLESFLMILAPWGRELFAAAGGLLSAIFVELASRLAEWPPASLQVPKGNPVYLLLYLPLAALLILSRERDTIRTAGAQNAKEDDRDNPGNGTPG